MLVQGDRKEGCKEYNEINGYPDWFMQQGIL